MAKRISGLDQLFIEAEQCAYDRSLFPDSGDHTAERQLEGILDKRAINRRLKSLAGLNVDDYIAETVAPSEQKSRLSAKQVLRRFPGDPHWEVEDGPLYACELEIDIDGEARRIGLLSQERTVNNGVWGPEHHLQAVEVVRRFAAYSMPIVTFIDTPGADAGDVANRNNQAHSISRLITEMAMVDLPTIGIILGNGYSGGAIPLATSNVLLSVRDGVFNTIQPQGLASIARKYDLSWQECAKYVGVSSYELYTQGYIDGIIDYVPGEKDKYENLVRAIASSIRYVERHAANFVANNPSTFDHYRRSIHRYLTPSDNLEQLQRQSALATAASPTSQLNVFGVTYRYLRYLGLRRRIRSTTIESYGRLSTKEIPKGDLQERIRREHEHAFEQWLANPLEVRYDDRLSKAWRQYRERKTALHTEPGKLMTWLRGDPSRRFEHAQRELQLYFTFYLYNLWKAGAHHSFLLLIEHLRNLDDQQATVEDSDCTVLQILEHPELREGFIQECQNLLIFDLIYDNIIHSRLAIAKEAKDYNIIAKNSVGELLEQALERATVELAAKQKDDSASSRSLENELKDQFYVWLNRFIKHNRRGVLLKSVQEWKKMVHPRISEPLFAIITYFLEHLLPRFYESEMSSREYDGQITLRDIGMKDFWNRLAIAYQDILIEDVLLRVKKSGKQTAPAFLEQFFSDFEEINGNLMTADPVNFPGFRISIEQALAKGHTPCGTITGIGRFKGKTVRRRVGVVVSNLAFQAGAFDMASAEKFCNLLVECAKRRLPVICFLSSGGMQTKEGAGSLFSMAIVNDRISRFVRDNDLPIVCFGFGDCTGGAQASLVTHPLVQTYYFSGTNMPFAGQIVVPSYLPTTSTLSNYLSAVPGAMQGLVSHPFAEDLDEQLLEIDRAIPVAKDSVEDVVKRVIKEGVIDAGDEGEEEADDDEHVVGKVERVLIHARGCTAAKLIPKAQEKGIQVVLIQSDPDMDSAPAEMLGDNDTLICLGGNTPDESYLNAGSVVRIAEREKVDALHPGIGFLSENAHFAALCQTHGLNFIGPTAKSMELMGNKSNAINTALRLKVPVVPGSHGIITSSEAAAQLADDIGYPVIIKAVHGGGGKGIQIVRTPESFHELFLKIGAEAKAAFGSSDVYIEKCVVSLRHVEIQILRDTHGNTKVLGLRDCSVQRDNQKIVEESGSTMLPADLEQSMYDSAAAIADDIDYRGAGTVEFIFDLASQAVYFMEMNTRLQVEHPVTERVSGIDIVGAQFDIASGLSIESLKPKPKGYAIEVRVNAEKAVIVDDDIQFLPQPGEITELLLPEYDHIDIIAAVAEKKVVSPYYDSLILQIICTGKDRDDTIDKLLAYLGEVRIKGICTNIPLLRRILDDEVFRKGDYDTGYLPAFIKRIDCEAMIEEIEEEAGIVRMALDREMLQIEGTDELKVVSPSTGVFYGTPSPAEPEFVKVGDVIDVSQTICLLEAMKVFRTLTLDSFDSNGEALYPATHSYKVVRVVPTSGQAVNTGDLLLVVKPV